MSVLYDNDDDDDDDDEQAESEDEEEIQVVRSYSFFHFCVRTSFDEYFQIYRIFTKFNVNMFRLYRAVYT